MIKRLLNRLSLSRILSILVLSLLLPSTAWGQTTYKGGDYSSNNGSWGDWTVTGTNVGFSSSDGILMCSVPADQTSTIELSLTQTQNTSEKLCALTYFPGTSSYSLLSAKIVNSNDETITDFTAQLKANGGSRFFNAATPIDWGEGKKLVLTCQFVNESNTVANPSITGATVTTGTPYDLIVGGITVTNVNQDNITGETTWNGSTNVPKIYFTPASTQESMSIPATLYLYEAEIKSSDGNSIVSSLSTTLYVNLSGNSTINSGSYLPFENTTGSDADLVFTTAPTGTPGKLTMTSNNVGFSSSSFSTGFHEVLFPQNAGALNAVAGTNGVVEIRQINTYGLSIVGTIVTDTNASNILGTGIEGKVSFNPSTNTLTLDGATINGSIGTSIDGLKIDIKGTNTINAPQDGYAIQSLTDSQLYIYFKSSTTPVGSLIMNTSQDSPFSDIYIFYEDNLLTKADYEHYSCIGEDYHITVGDYNVNSVNASNVLRDDFNSVSYNKATSTLSLNNVSIWRISHGAPQALTIEFSGTNTIGSITGYGGNENPLTIIKKNGSSSAFLDVNTEGQSLDDMGPIFHFSSCTWGEGLYLEAYSGETPISGVYYDNGSRRQFKQASGKSISRVVFSGNQPTATPSIWIGGLEPNAEGKFINPDNNTSIQGVTFDKTNNVLTLDEANLSDDIISSLPNLTIKLTGENGERVGRSDLDGNKYIISTNPSATLTFTTDGDNSLWSSKDNYEIPWKGFAGNPIFENKLVFLQAAGTMSIQVLHAPTMGYSSGNLTFSGLSDGYGNGFDCYYSITYEDGNGNIETTKYEPGNGAQPNPVSMEGKPCTVKAYVTYEDRLLNTTKSDIATAYYFGFANDLKVTFDGTEKEIQKSEFPKLIPEVENIDFILSNSTNTNVIYLENDGGHIKKKGLGTTDLVLNISHDENTKVLNSGGGAVYLTAKVIPSAPTFSVVEGTYDETQTLTLSSSYQKSNSDDQTVVNIKYYTSEDPDKHNPYTAPITIDHTTTITAWVEALITSAAGGTQETITSDTITQEYIIKEEAFIDFMQEENDKYITIEAGQVITGTYGNTIPQVVMPSISDLHGTITFSSSNETVVASSSISLDEENKLKYTVSGAGQTTIQASYTPTEEEPILPTTSSFNLKIEPRAITNATISMGTNGETSFVYKGTAIEPITSVSLAASETAVAATLNAETDFDLNYYMVSGETETEQEGAPTNVGSYKVTVNAKGNYTGSKSATFTITPATITPKVVITGWAYGATANTPTVSGNTGNGSVTYEYKLQNAEDSKYSTEVPNEAGDYTIKATIAATANYEAAVDSTHFTIAKANITPTITLEGWTFGATANTPEVTGNTGNGAETFTYKAEGSEAFTSEVPTAVGTHIVKVTIAETTNYNGGEATTTFTITNRTFNPANDITFAEGQTYASFYSSSEDLELPEEGIAVFMITGLNGNTLTTQAVSYIPKGVPVLIEKTETAVEAKDPSEVGTNMLQYATEDVAASGTLYILYNGEYVKATGTIPQGKCYLKLNKPSGARILTIGNNNGTTSISNFNADTETDRWFDLNGQRISKPQKKGLYIKNGKKIVVK